MPHLGQGNRHKISPYLAIEDHQPELLRTREAVISFMEAFQHPAHSGDAVSRVGKTLLTCMTPCRHLMVVNLQNVSEENRLFLEQQFGDPDKSLELHMQLQKALLAKSASCVRISCGNATPTARSRQRTVLQIR